MPKTTIREWLYTQHCPPEVTADFEKLFALASLWKKEASDPHAGDRQIALGDCAEDLEAILEGKSERQT